MKALNPLRRNHILFGFLVLTLAMSKSWLATADQGRADYASTAKPSHRINTQIQLNGKNIPVTGDIETVVRKGETITRLKDGKLETVQAPDVEETQLRITLDATTEAGECFDCSKRITLTGDIANLEAKLKQEAAAFAKEREAKLAQQKRDEERAKKCEIVEVDGKQTVIKDSVQLEDKDVASALIDCLENNDRLKLENVKPRLTAAIRRLLMNEDEEKRAQGKELLQLLKSAKGKDAALVRYIEGLEFTGRLAAKMREVEQSDSPYKAQVLNYLKDCANPNNPNNNMIFTDFATYQRYSCSSFLSNRTIDKSERQAMLDGMPALQGLACSLGAQPMPFTINGNMGRTGSPWNQGQAPVNSCSRNIVFEDGSSMNSGPVIHPHGGSGNISDSRSFRGQFNGSTPQFGAPVNYGYNNRYDMNALQSQASAQQNQGNQGSPWTRTGAVQNTQNAPNNLWTPGMPRPPLRR